jgi:hypothetical protein
VLNKARVTANSTWAFEIKAVNPDIAGLGSVSRGRPRRAAGSTEDSVAPHAYMPGTAEVLPELPGLGMSVNGWPLLSVWPCEPHTAASPLELQGKWV